MVKLKKHLMHITQKLPVFPRQQPGYNEFRKHAGIGLEIQGQHIVRIGRHPMASPDTIRILPYGLGRCHRRMQLISSKQESTTNNRKTSEAHCSD